MVPNRNGAVTSAVLVHLHVEPAHFDWRWRERPVLALLAWEAMARDPLARLRRIQVESIGTIINFSPAAPIARVSCPSRVVSLFLPGGITPVARSGRDWVSVADVVPLSSEPPTQSPAHSFVPLTVPTSLHPVGSFGFTWTSALLPTLGGALCANAAAEKLIATRISKPLIIIFPPSPSVPPSAR